MHHTTSFLLSTFVCLLCIGTVISCQGKKNSSATNKQIPDFQSDSAFSYLQRQTDFGPRVPNSAAHKACGDYLVGQFRAFGAEVIQQEAQVKAFDGTLLNMRNIIASFQTEKHNRILLCAHWDSRPWADNDSDPAHHWKPVPGANDGASGVAVLMEIGRQLGLSTLQADYGVDLILFDAEDYGIHASMGEDSPDSWCLGSKYWGTHPHKKAYTAKYGILLDMVGWKNARFSMEYFSRKYADPIVQKVWNQALSLGYGNYFYNEDGGAVTDDHLAVNRLAGIPCINIIDFDPLTPSGFFPYWHTIQDRPEHIDKEVLKAVGQTLLSLIYSESI